MSHTNLEDETRYRLLFILCINSDQPVMILNRPLKFYLSSIEQNEEKKRRQETIKSIVRETIILAR